MSRARQRALAEMVAGYGALGLPRTHLKIRAGVAHSVIPASAWEDDVRHLLPTGVTEGTEVLSLQGTVCSLDTIAPRGIHILE